MSNDTPTTVVPAQLGRFFEDFAVGTVYQHPFGRTI
ncbi:MAG TPA: monoamine oxidase, partial [Actinobacteria bacterium]|nr:monoamine oxidase [Actinomycetota bacterium]